MTKILIVALIIVVVSGVSFFYIFILGQKPDLSIVSPQASSAPVATLQNKPQPVPASASAKVASSSALEIRVETLEESVSDLQNQINSLKGSKASQTTVYASKSPIFIPLGNGASSSSTDWATSDALQVTIDPSQYSGYISMQLEMGLAVYQGNGQAYARLLDATDGISIGGSDISSTSQDYTWQTSNTFRLPSGSKVYKLQLKSITGYTASEQNARIKVNF
jgi:hypothetical protein